MSDGWDESATAWIASLGERGDFGRAFVLDSPMMERVRRLSPQTALDVGCGEGRFCRMLRAEGIETIGLDPTSALLDEARRLDPEGLYLEGVGEQLPFPDTSFDLVVSYLSLIDIPDMRKAIAEMARVLRPLGAILVANSTSFNTARDQVQEAHSGVSGVVVDRYLEERATWESWKGIRVRNWHRPLSAYMRAFLDQGLILTHFDEPAPSADADPRRAERYRRAPYFHIMEWRKAV